MEGDGLSWPGVEAPSEPNGVGASDPSYATPQERPPHGQKNPHRPRDEFETVGGTVFGQKPGPRRERTARYSDPPLDGGDVLLLCVLTTLYSFPIGRLRVGLGRAVVPRGRPIAVGG